MGFGFGLGLALLHPAVEGHRRVSRCARLTLALALALALALTLTLTKVGGGSDAAEWINVSEDEPRFAKFMAAHKPWVERVRG